MATQLDECSLLAIKIIEATVRLVFEKQKGLRKRRVYISQLMIEDEQLNANRNTHRCVQFDGYTQTTERGQSDSQTLLGWIKFSKASTASWANCKVGAKIACNAWNWTVLTISTRPQARQMKLEVLSGTTEIDTQLGIIEIQN